MRDQPPERKHGTAPDQHDTTLAQGRKEGAARHKKLIGKWLSRATFEKLTGRPGKGQ